MGDGGPTQHILQGMTQLNGDNILDNVHTPVYPYRTGDVNTPVHGQTRSAVAVECTNNTISDTIEQADAIGLVL